MAFKRWTSNVDSRDKTGILILREGALTLILGDPQNDRADLTVNEINSLSAARVLVDATAPPIVPKYLPIYIGDDDVYYERDGPVFTPTGGTGTVAPDATANVKGIVKLANDLGGTSALPTVPGLAGKASQAALDLVASTAAAAIPKPLSPTAHQLLDWSVPTAAWKARDASEVDARAQFGFGRQAVEADEPAAFQAARTFAAGRPVRLTAGDYPCVSELTANDRTTPIRIIGDGAGSTRLLYKAVGTRLIRMLGSFDYLGVTTGNEWDKGQPVTEAVPLLSRVWKLGSTAGLVAGDYIKIRDEGLKLISRWEGSTLGVAGQSCRVRSVDSATQITVFGGAVYPYTTTARVVKYNPIRGVMIRDVTVHAPDAAALLVGPIVNGLPTVTAASIAFDLQHCVDPEIANVGFTNMPTAMISLAHVIGGTIQSVTSVAGRNDLGSGPYVVKFGPGCQGIGLLAPSSRFGRHITTSTGAAHEIVPSFISVIGGRAFEHSANPYDQHPAARWWQFLGCHATMGSRDDQRNANDKSAVGGFHPRGWDNVISNCHVVGHDVGIGLFAGAERLLVTGGLIERCRIGVASQTLDGLRMRGTVIKDSTEHHMLFEPISYSTGVKQVKNVDIDGSVTLEGDPSIAAAEFRAWDASNRFAPRIIGATRPVVGMSVHKLVNAPTLKLPLTADYFEVPLAGTITKIEAPSEQTGRRVRLAFTNGATLAGPNIKVTHPTVPAGIEVDFALNDFAAVELSRAVSPIKYLLNQIASGATWRAYGLRKLRFGYAGAAVRVRRSSDNTEQDIGFTALGALDTAALLTFAGAGSAFVKTLYDQTDKLGPLHITQATAANQPMIVDTGVLVTTAGKVGWKHNGTSHILTDTTVGLAAGLNASVFAILAGDIAAIKDIVSEARGVGATTASYTLLGTSVSRKPSSSVVNDAGTVLLAASGVSADVFTSPATLHGVSVVDSAIYTADPAVDADGNPINPDPIYSSSSQLFKVDGGTAATRTYTRTGTFADLTAFGIGGRPTATPAHAPVTLSELLLFTSAVSDTDRATIEASHAAWIAA